MRNKTDIGKASRKNGTSGAIGIIAIASALVSGQGAWPRHERGEIRAEDVAAKPARNGRFPYLSNHPCGSRQAKRSASQNQKGRTYEKEAGDANG